MDTPRENHHKNEHDYDNTGQESGRVVYLPHAVPDTGNADPEPEVVDAEIVDDTPDQTSEDQQAGERSGERSVGRALERSGERLPWRAPAGEEIDYRVYGPFGFRRIIPYEARVRMAEGGGELAERSVPVVKSGGKAGMQHLVHTVNGIKVVWDRWRDAHGASRYERMMRAAEVQGEHERLLEWEARDVAEKQRRHQRAMDWLRSPLDLVKYAAILIGSLAGFFLVLGVVMAIAQEDAGLILAPISGVIDAITWTYWFLATYGALLLCGATALAVVYVHGEGRRHGTWQPGWLSNPAAQVEDLVVLDEDSITRALSNTHVTALNRALKNEGRIEYLIHPREQGGGTYTQIRLPLGVKAADFLHPERIETLAGNLGRHKHEVYPQRLPDADARVLDLWVADRGTMDKPAPAWPLLDSGEFDVFRDRLPWGVTMRGEQVSQGMLARHVFYGALSKQGKTATMRRDALGLALDPTVELRIADLKGDGDWSMFAPRATALIEGGGEQQAAETCDMLEELVAEMQRRYDTKRAMGFKGNITRELSRRPGSGFHPIYCFVDECQVLYQAEHPVGGTAKDARAWKAARRIHDQARAVNIHLYQATQRPDPSAVPFQVREGPHVRACLHVANHEAAKMVLADAAERGARPQDLRSGRDAGTVVVAGEVDDIPEGMAFTIVRSHYIGTTEAYAVINRAMDILAAHGRSIGHGAPEALPEARDLLADLVIVLEDAGATRMRTQEVLQRLVELAPATYRDWTFTDLKEHLADTAAAIYKSDGHKVISLARVRTAITERDEHAG